MPLREIRTDPTRRELSAHGTLEFPLQINYDCLFSFYERYVRCHWHEELEIPVVLSGTIRCQLWDQSIILEPGQGILINTRVPHSYTPLSREEPRLMTTVFHPSLLYGTPSDVTYRKYLHPYLCAEHLPGTLLSPEEVRMMQQLKDVVEQARFGFELQTRSLLLELFQVHLSRYQDQLAIQHPAQEPSFARMNTMLEYLHANYREPLQLAQLARTVSLSKESCCRLFKKMTGKTILQYLEDYRVSQGMLLLQQSPDTITQIAYQLGFSNPSRFSAAFAERMHMTPHQYRSQLSAGR